MLCSCVLSGMGNVDIIPEVKEYISYDGTTNKTCGIANLEVEYNKKVYDKKIQCCR
ncbi:MAG: hypothetical protein ACRC0V_11715 [Fusobacteriaceae bacterium]